MTSPRRSTTLAGLFFILAAITAIAALELYQPVLHDPRYIVEASRNDARVLLGACCEIAVAVCVVGTAVVLLPIIRVWGERSALAYLAGRVLEAAVILIGIISLLTILTVRTDPTGGSDGSLIAIGRALVALHNWTFLFGPGLLIGINTTLLAAAIYRSQLVPRAIPLIGLFGGPLEFGSSLAVLFGAYSQTSAPAALAAIPVTVWELALAIRMIATGFKSSEVVDPAGSPGATDLNQSNA